MGPEDTKLPTEAADRKAYVKKMRMQLAEMAAEEPVPLGKNTAKKQATLSDSAARLGLERPRPAEPAAAPAAAAPVAAPSAAAPVAEPPKQPPKKQQKVAKAKAAAEEEAAEEEDVDPHIAKCMKANQCEKHPMCTRGFRHEGKGGKCSIPKGDAADTGKAATNTNVKAAAKASAPKPPPKKALKAAVEAEAEEEPPAANEVPESSPPADSEPSPGRKRKAKPGELAKLLDLGGGGKTSALLHAAEQQLQPRQPRSRGRPGRSEEDDMAAAIAASLQDQETRPKKAAKVPRELANLKEDHFDEAVVEATGTRSWRGR